MPILQIPILKFAHPRNDRDAKIGLSRYLDRWYYDSRLQGADDQQGAIAKATTASLTTLKAHEYSEFKQWVKSMTARATVTGSELERYLRLSHGGLMILSTGG